MSVGECHIHYDSRKDWTPRAALYQHYVMFLWAVLFDAISKASRTVGASYDQDQGYSKLSSATAVCLLFPTLVSL